MPSLFPPTPIVDYSGYRELPFARERVWRWMLDHPAELLALDPFHARVEAPPLPLERGVRIPIDHEFPFGYRERRDARINALRPYVIGFGEVRNRGYDAFPHSYRFKLGEAEPNRTILCFDIRGRFRLPAARFWLVPVFDQIAPGRIRRGLARLAATIHAHLRESSSPGDQTPSASLPTAV